ncbi:hypothetical protein M0P48_01950 [Candidatus Gracilibacteria bacterium]|nr:hypothetical protein [Candidatus Gracilibacteria bacterium]
MGKTPTTPEQNRSFLAEGANDQTALIPAFGILRNLRNISSKYHLKFLADFDEYIVGNPNFNQEAVARFRQSLLDFWEAAAKPAGGEDADGKITLEALFNDPRQIAKTAELDKRYEEDIKPVIEDTQKAITAILSQED